MLGANPRIQQWDMCCRVLASNSVKTQLGLESYVKSRIITRIMEVSIFTSLLIDLFIKFLRSVSYSNKQFFSLSADIDTEILSNTDNDTRQESKE